MKPDMPFTLDELRAVPYAAVHDYLTRRGWHPVPTPNPDLQRFEHPQRFQKANGQPIYLYFPVLYQEYSYPLSVLSFFRAMSVLYDTTQDIVFRELTGRLPSFQVPAPMPAAS